MATKLSSFRLTDDDLANLERHRVAFGAATATEALRRLLKRPEQVKLAGAGGLSRDGLKGDEPVTLATHEELTPHMRLPKPAYGSRLKKR